MEWLNEPALWSSRSPLQLRVEKRREAIHVFYQDINSEYTLLRLAYFPIASKVQVKLTCASPEGKGYEVVFKNYQLTGADGVSAKSGSTESLTK